MAGSSFSRLLAAAMSAAISLALFGAAPARAADREVVIAYQDMVLPWRYAQATGEVERATGYKVTYRQLASGADVVRAIASGSGPRRSLMVFGYAGWRAGQLEGEFETGSWISVPADEALVFGDDYKDKWRRALARRTIDL